jgi:hypothetical protein
MRKLACIVVVAACGGGGSTNVKPTLKFADRSDAELSQLISAAGGTAMFSAQAQVDQFSSSTDTCPAVAVDGQTITLTGGCTTQDGVMVAGTATATNSPSWDQITYDYTSGTSYQLTGLALTQSGFTQSYDGRVDIADNFTVYDGDVTSTMLDVTIRSDIHYECDAGDRTCDLSGSGIELVGAGGVLVSGSVDLNTNTQHYTLHGADTLTATISAGCVAYQISGSDRMKACP